MSETMPRARGPASRRGDAPAPGTARRAARLVGQGGGARTCAPRGDRQRHTLGALMDAVLQFSADSHEAALVIENLIATGRVRLTSPGSGSAG